MALVSSSSVKTGNEVFTVGFPNIGLQGTEPKYTQGTISSLTGIANSPRHFQISTPVQPGNSGGPLIDVDGNVIGVIVARLSEKNTLITTGMLPENVNYAIKSSFILPLFETIPELNNELSKSQDSKLKDRTKQIEYAKTAAVLIVTY